MHARSTRPSLARFAVVIGTLLSITALASLAAAETITLDASYPQREGTARKATPTKGPAAPNTGTNRDDCLSTKTYYQFKFAFPTAAADWVTPSSLQLWVNLTGGSCANSSARVGDAKSCYHVATIAYSSVADHQLVRIPDVAFVAALSPTSKKDVSYDVSAVADAFDRATECTTNASMEPRTFYISLLPFNGETDVTTGGDAFEALVPMGFDIAGPSAPTSIKGGGGNGLAKIDWSASSGATATLQGYQTYVVPYDLFGDGHLDGGTISPDSATPTDASADTGDTGDAADAADAKSTTTDTTDTSTGDAAAVATDFTCVGAFPPWFAPGILPSGELAKYAGSFVGPGSTSAQVTGLDNEKSYAVGVAAIDSWGNPGVISDIRCVTPKPTRTFYDAYEEAGGRGGGGYCSYAPIGPTPLALTLGVCALGLLARRRRS